MRFRDCRVSIEYQSGENYENQGTVEVATATSAQSTSAQHILECSIRVGINEHLFLITIQ